MIGRLEEQMHEAESQGLNRPPIWGSLSDKSSKINIVYLFYKRVRFGVIPYFRMLQVF